MQKIPKIIVKKNPQKKNKIALFFNSERGLNVFKNLKKNYSLDVYLSHKNLRPKLKIYLKKKNIKFRIIKKITKGFIKKIKSKNYFLIISAGYPLVFPNDLIEAAANHTINLHGGPLPSYRGGSPLNWQIINGEKNIKISIIKMAKDLDTGPIYCNKKFKLKKNDTIKTVHQKVNNLFPGMVNLTIKKIKNKIKPLKQTNKNIKYYKQRSEKDGLINWNMKNAHQVYNFVRAVTKPYPGAFYYYKKKFRKILRCNISQKNPNFRPGTLFYEKNQKFIKCKKNSIKII